MSLQTEPPLDRYTLETLDYIDELRAGQCCEGNLDRLWSLDAYAALLESGEVDAAGRLRCAGWARSKGRRCIERSRDHDWRGRPSYCCTHKGFYVSGRTPLGEWFCPTHSEATP